MRKFYNIKDLTVYFLITMVIGLSLVWYSSVYYPILNSDDGITILMIKYFSFSTDLYYWGQDRYGSIIPLIGHIFYKWLSISPVMIESILHYTILISGFLAISSFLPKPKHRLLLAIAWFLPPFHMIDLLRNTMGLQISLFAVSLFFILKTVHSKTFYGFLARLFISFLLIVLTIWVSDVAIISFFALFIVFFFTRNALRMNLLSVYNNFNLKQKVTLSVLLLLLVSGAALFLNYARITATPSEGYFGFSFFYLYKNLLVLLEGLYSMVLFNVNEPFTSLYLALIIIFILLLVPIKKKSSGFLRELSGFSKLVFWVILFDLIFSIIVILASKWVYLNFTGRRYFVTIYIEFIILFLFWLESFKNHKLKAFLFISLFFILLTGAVGTNIQIKHVWPRESKPTTEKYEEFKLLGNSVGIIGSYSNTYVIAAIHPNRIIATPHQLETIRNRRFIPLVLKEDKIFLIKEGWLENFPDSIKQFDVLLVKKGNEIVIGGLGACEYQIQKQN